MKGEDKHFELAGARVIDTRDQLDFQFAYFSALQCVKYSAYLLISSNTET